MKAKTIQAGPAECTPCNLIPHPSNVLFSVRISALFATRGCLNCLSYLAGDPILLHRAFSSKLVSNLQKRRSVIWDCECSCVAAQPLCGIVVAGNVKNWSHFKVCFWIPYDFKMFLNRVGLYRVLWRHSIFQSFICCMFVQAVNFDYSLVHSSVSLIWKIEWFLWVYFIKFGILFSWIMQKSIKIFNRFFYWTSWMACKVWVCARLQLLDPTFKGHYIWGGLQNGNNMSLSHWDISIWLQLKL